MRCNSPDATVYIGGFNGSIGWELTNTATGKSEYDYDDVSNNKIFTGYSTFRKILSSNKFAEGATYLLYPIVFDKSKKR